MICRMCGRIKVNVLLYTVSFEAFSDIPPSAPWGICKHAILGMDSKFPIWHVHLRLFWGSRILFLSGLHYSSTLVLQEFYNCKYENKNYGFGICTLSLCQPGFAVEVRHMSVFCKWGIATVSQIRWWYKNGGRHIQQSWHWKTVDETF